MAGKMSRALEKALLKGHAKDIRRVAAQEGPGCLNSYARCGLSALAFVACNRSEDLAVLLMDLGADPVMAYVDPEGPEVQIDEVDRSSLLHMAARLSMPSFLGRLLGAQAGVDERDGTGETPLMSAVVGGDSECVRVLAQAGADVRAVDADGNPALIKAVANDELTLAVTLVEAGADVDQRGEFGMTALMEAAFWGREDHVELLLDAGADAMLRDEAGESAAMMARANGHEPLAQRIESRERAQVATRLHTEPPSRAAEDSAPCL